MADKSKKEIREEQITEARKMYLMGEGIEAICSALNVKERWARELIKRGKERAVEHLKALEGSVGVAHEVDVLNHVRCEALRAWNASREPIKKETSKIVEDKPHESIAYDHETGEIKKQPPPRRRAVVTKTVIESTGDPRHLQVALEASAQIRDLLGIKAPDVLKVMHEGTIMSGETLDELMKREPAELIRAYNEALARAEAS